MKFDQEAYDRQVAEQKAESARLKALWDKENAVDKGARRERAAKEAAEKEARETPSAEDQARGKEIFDKVSHHWQDPHKHRLLLADDGTILKHVFTLWITDPFHKSAHEHNITLPADKFVNDLHWCVLFVSHDLQREWTRLLEQEAQTQRQQLENAAFFLRGHEEDSKPKPPPPPPPPIKAEDYEGLCNLAIGVEIKGMISVKVVDLDKDTGDLKLLITDHGVDHKHVLAGKTYTFELHTGDKGDYNMWSLREEEDESWDGRGTGADLLLVFDHGDWLFDLDS